VPVTLCRCGHPESLTYDRDIYNCEHCDRQCQIAGCGNCQVLNIQDGTGPRTRPGGAELITREGILLGLAAPDLTPEIADSLLDLLLLFDEESGGDQPVPPGHPEGSAGS
jgi:hypothetical protein